jgi:cyclase
MTRNIRHEITRDVGRESRRESGRENRREILELADGVFAYLQLDGGWCLSNAGIVRGGDTSLVVDTAATVARAHALRQTVERLGGRTPVTIVNTHHHGDHVFGNCAFDPGTTIVAHDLARAEMAAAGLDLRRMWPEVVWGEVELRLPTITFRERLTLYTAGLVAELVHVGPAHTTNDIVVWLPDRKVLFAGDVVSNGVTPFTLMGSIAGSLVAIERLRAFGAAVIVPGHGPAGGVEMLDRNAEYLRWIQRLAADGAAAGLSPLETARAADLGEYADLIDSERIVGNLARAHAELRDAPLGLPLDVHEVFHQMVDYHGELPACFA